jgi:heme/copper-type cytochrome/quinol oxidase subunit 1
VPLPLPLQLTVLQVVLGGAAAWPALRFGGRAGLQSMLLAAGLSWLAVVASYVVLGLTLRRVAHFHVVVVVGGFLVRFALLFALLALVSKTLPVDLGQIVLWLVGFYMVLVVAEAWSLSRGTTRRSPEV